MCVCDLCETCLGVLLARRAELGVPLPYEPLEHGRRERVLTLAVRALTPPPGALTPPPGALNPPLGEEEPVGEFGELCVEWSEGINEEPKRNQRGTKEAPKRHQRGIKNGHL